MAEVNGTGTDQFNQPPVPNTVCVALNTGPNDTNPCLGTIVRIMRRKYMRKYRYRLNQTPISESTVVKAAAIPIDKKLLDVILTSRTALVWRNMCDIKKSEKENSDRIKTLSRRVLRRFGHLFTGREFDHIHGLLTSISKQAETISHKYEKLVEATQQILHHELITRQFIRRGIITRNKEPRRNKIEEVRRNFYLKMLQCNSTSISEPSEPIDVKGTVDDDLQC